VRAATGPTGPGYLTAGSASQNSHYSQKAARRTLPVPRSRIQRILRILRRECVSPSIAARSAGPEDLELLCRPAGILPEPVVLVAVVESSKKAASPLHEWGRLRGLRREWMVVKRSIGVERSSERSEPARIRQSSSPVAASARRSPSSPPACGRSSTGSRTRGSRPRRNGGVSGRPTTASRRSPPRCERCCESPWGAWRGARGIHRPYCSCSTRPKRRRESGRLVCRTRAQFHYRTSRPREL
jgi:hypothetical protein